MTKSSKANYRVSGISIEGFRGIRNLDVEFPVRKPVHLIGGNNSGKSTVLNAVALALGGGGFHQFRPEEFDFFHRNDGDAAAEFAVTVNLSAESITSLPAVQGVGKPTPVHGVRVRGTTDQAGRHSHRQVLVDGNDEAITISPRTVLKGDAKENYQGRANLGWRPSYARLDDIRSEKPEVWLLTPQNLERSLYEWKTGPLQRLSSMLARRFLDTEWEFKHGSSVRSMPRTLIRAHEFFQDAVEGFPFWQDDLKPRLEETLSRYVGSQARFGLRPDVQTIKDWLTQQLVVSFAADSGGAVTPLDRMGDGWQSLIRLAALDVISQYPDQAAERVVLLAEEPETHLHPHLRRKMRVVLERLADQGWTVITATHGPEFMSFGNPQLVVRLWRVGDEVTKKEFDTKVASNAVKFQEKLEERGNHEMLFAHRAILCEGKADCWAIRSCLGKLHPDLDLDAVSVSLVDVGSIQNLPDYADIARRLGIPWCAVTDEDRKHGMSVNPTTESTRKRLDAMGGPADMSTMWPGSLEDCVGIGPPKKATPVWQLSEIDPKPLDQMRRDHPQLVTVCERISGWILG